MFFVRGKNFGTAKTAKRAKKIYEPKRNPLDFLCGIRHFCGNKSHYSAKSDDFPPRTVTSGKKADKRMGRLYPLIR